MRSLHCSKRHLVVCLFEHHHLQCMIYSLSEPNAVLLFCRSNQSMQAETFPLSTLETTSQLSSAVSQATLLTPSTQRQSLASAVL